MPVGTTRITVVGNLTHDPELRFTNNGRAVANFTVASTEKNFSKESQQWEDGDTLFLRCNVWGEVAENVAESLQKGMRAVVVGDLKTRQYETKEGEKRTVWELEVAEVAPSLKYATAKVTRSPRQNNGQNNQQGGGQNQRQQQGQGQQGGWGGPQQDAGGWGGPPQGGQQGGWGQQQPAWGGNAGDPPF